MLKGLLDFPNTVGQPPLPHQKESLSEFAVPLPSEKQELPKRQIVGLNGTTNNGKTVGGVPRALPGSGSPTRGPYSGGNDTSDSRRTGP